MSKWKHYIGSSIGGIRCCDDEITQPDPENPTGWRALASSRTCVQNGSGNTGYVHVVTLEQYYLSNNTPTGTTKPNVPSDPNYIPDYLDTLYCANGEPEPLPSQNVELVNGSTDKTVSAVLVGSLGDIRNVSNTLPGETKSSLVFGGTYRVTITAHNGSTESVVTCNGQSSIFYGAGSVTFYGVVPNPGINITIN